MPESTGTRRAARAKSAAQSANGGDRPSRARRRVKETVEEPESAVDNVRDTAEDATETATDTVKGGSSAGGQTVREELTSIVREAVLEVLTPVARKATLQAAKYAITQGPSFAGKNLPKLRDRLDEAGGIGGIGNAAREITTGLPDRGRAALEGRGIGRSGGENRKLPLQMSIDIAAPQDITYEELANRLPDLKAFKDGEIVDEEPGVRLDWEGEPAATAVITLHSLADDLTRVMVSYETGSSGVRGAMSGGIISRGLRSDLRRLKADLELGVPEEPDTEDEPESEPEPERKSSRERKPRSSSRRTKARAEEEPEDEEDDTRGEADIEEPEAEEDEDVRGEAEPEAEASSDDEAEDEYAEADSDSDSDSDADADADAEKTTRRKPVSRRAPARKGPTSQKSQKTSRESSRR